MKLMPIIYFNPEIILADIKLEIMQFNLQLSYTPEITAEAYTETKHKIDKHQIYPGNPSVGKTSKGGAFIEASKEYYSNRNIQKILQQNQPSISAVHPS
jgi:hypothetical protein